MEETRSTLQFGASIKRIRTKANINILSSASKKDGMSQELIETKKALTALKNKEQSLMKQNEELKSMVESLKTERDGALSKLEEMRSERNTPPSRAVESHSDTTYVYSTSKKMPVKTKKNEHDGYYLDGKEERSDGFPAAVAVSVDSSDSFSEATDPTGYDEAIAT